MFPPPGSLRTLGAALQRCYRSQNPTCLFDTAETAESHALWLLCVSVAASFLCQQVIRRYLTTHVIPVAAPPRVKRPSSSTLCTLGSAALSVAAPALRANPHGACAHSLPYEIWAIVFHHVVAGPLSDHFRQSSKVAAVCRYWRELSLSLPELWDTLFVDLDREVNTEYIQLMLHRSSNSTIRIWLDHRNGHSQALKTSSTDEECNRLSAIVLLLSARAQCIRLLHAVVSCGYAASHLLEKLTGTAKALQSLEILCSRTGVVEYTRGHVVGEVFHLWSNRTWTPHFEAPSLESLVLTVGCPELPLTLAHFTTVRSLTLVFGSPDILADYKSLWQVLCSLKSLSTLKLDGASVPARYHRFLFTLLDLQPQVADDKIYEFPSLQHLSLDNVPSDLPGYMLSRSRFPLLSQLDVANVSCHLSMESFFAHLNSSENAPVLHTVRFSNFSSRALYYVLPHLTRCRHLSLVNPGALEDGDLTSMSLPHPPHNTPACPDLTTLEIHDAPLISVQALRRLVHGRKDGRTASSALQTLRVWHSAQIAEWDYNWFRDNVPTFQWYHLRRRRTVFDE